MVYGIISSLDNTATKEVLKSKKIRKERLFYNDQLNVLLRVLVSGDVVYVMSVNRFMNLIQLREVSDVCFQRGISLRFIEQPYLNVRKGKYWRDSVLCLTERMLQLERDERDGMQQSSRFNDEQWCYVRQRMEGMNLEILAQIFSCDGIMKRGS